MAELSKRGVAKLAESRGLLLSVDSMRLLDLRGEPVFTAEAQTSRPDHWRALIAYLEPLDKPSASVEPAKSEPKKHNAGKWPTEGPFQITGFCFHPGLDGHGHVLCQENQYTNGCICTCHEGK